MYLQKLCCMIAVGDQPLSFCNGCSLYSSVRHWLWTIRTHVIIIHVLGKHIKFMFMVLYLDFI